MPNLSFAQQQNVRHHLGYTSRAVPTGDEVILNKALEDNTRTAEWVLFGGRLLQRCDRTFEKTEMDQQDSGVAYRRVLVGDRNYSDIEYRAEPRRQREQAYVAETNRLARFLGVTNYTDPNNWQYLNVSAIRQ